VADPSGITMSRNRTADGAAHPISSYRQHRLEAVTGRRPGCSIQFAPALLGVLGQQEVDRLLNIQTNSH
jgi:hypothetical protein